MLNTLSRKSFVAASAALTLALAGCQSQSRGLENADNIDWINSPGAIENYLAAAGSTPVVSELDIGQARNRAARDARVQLAATLQTRVQSMAEDWSKMAGELSNAESLSSLVNSETFTRIRVDEAVKGARVDRYKQQGKTLYCLVVLDDPVQWVKNVGKDLGAELLKDETMLKTDVLKSEMRDRLEEQERKESELQRSRMSRFEREVQE